MRVLTKREKLCHCAGCYNDVYNHGLGGATECWAFADAKLVWRKKVHIDQIPPWTQKASKYLVCRLEQRYVFVEPNATHYEVL